MRSEVQKTIEMDWKEKRNCMHVCTPSQWGSPGKKPACLLWRWLLWLSRGPVRSSATVRCAACRTKITFMRRQYSWSSACGESQRQILLLYQSVRVREKEGQRINIFSRLDALKYFPTERLDYQLTTGASREIRFFATHQEVEWRIWVREDKAPKIVSVT